MQTPLSGGKKCAESPVFTAGTQPGLEYADHFSVDPGRLDLASGGDQFLFAPCRRMGDGPENEENTGDSGVNNRDQSADPPLG